MPKLREIECEGSNGAGVSDEIGLNANTDTEAVWICNKTRATETERDVCWVEMRLIDEYKNIDTHSLTTRGDSDKCWEEKWGN